jgi:alkylation response protein AidB-like acyl-CoA dehydrogenase
MFATEMHQRAVTAALRAFGLYGGVIDPQTGPIAPFVKAYMETLSLTIAGGTSEIQRHVIATRGLGLPRS